MEEGMIFDFKVEEKYFSAHFFFLVKRISSFFTQIWNQRKSLYPRSVKSTKNFQLEKKFQGRETLLSRVIN